MFKKMAVFSLLLTLAASPLYAAGLNISFPGCTNSTLENCYPFFYQNPNGSNNHFANLIAGENIFGLIYNIFVLQLGNMVANVVDARFAHKIDKALVGLANGESYSKNLLSEIIVGFDNGIGDDFDPMVTASSVEYLIALRCKSCTNAFLDIACKNTKTNEKKENREKFHALAKTLKRSVTTKKCDHSEDGKQVEIDTLRDIEKEKTFFRRCRDAVLRNWQHPAHWSNIIYALGTYGFAVGLAFALPNEQRAGALWGDLANGINAWCIPTYAIFNVLQKFLYQYSSRKKHMNREITKRARAFDLNSHIFGLVVGQMDNGIGYEEARGYLMTLIILGWPQDLVAEFADLASKNDSDYTQFRKKLVEALADKGITYSDRYTEAALINKAANNKAAILKRAHELEEIVEI